LGAPFGAGLGSAIVGVGFNGNLGMLGATQAQPLIQLITSIVAPGEWFITPPPQPQIQPIFGAVGAAGAAGQIAPLGQIGLPAPQAQGGPADIQQANTINFFPSALALIVRAPSRIHSSITGGIIGGKAKRIEAAVKLEELEKKLQIAGNNK